MNEEHKPDLEALNAELIQARERVLELEDILHNIPAARQHLRENNAFFKLFVEDAAFGYFETDVNGTITFCNAHLARIGRYRPEEIIGRNFTQLIHPDDVEAALEDFQLSGLEPNDGAREYRIIDKDGNIHAVSINCIPIGENIEISGFHGTILDVSDRVEIESRLAEQNRLNALRTEIWKLGADQDLSEKDLIQALLNMVGPQLGVSRACYNITEGKDAVCVMEWCADGVRPSLDTRGPARIMKLFENDGIVEISEAMVLERIPKGLRTVTIPLVKGVVRLLDIETVLGAPIHSGGEVYSWLTFDVCRSQTDKPAWTDTARNVVRDVAQIIAQTVVHRRIESALVASEERFRSIFTESSIGLILFGPQGELLEMNRAMLNILHTDDAEAFADVNIFDYTQLGPRDRERLKQGETIHTQTPYDFELIKKTGRYKTHGSGVIHMDAVINPMGMPEAGEFRGYLVSLQDVTESRNMQQELLKAQKLESLGILAGGIAHDFHNILTGVMGNISMAKIELEGTGSAYRLLDHADRAVSRAQGLTKQLLSFAPEGELVKRIALVSELVKDAALFALQGSRVKTEFNLAADLWAAEVDEAQMGQVISNLVSNAADAMNGAGTVQIIAQNVATGAEEELPLEAGHYVRIIIRDTGIGIPPDLLGRIFDPFFTTKPDGTGLGLAITYSIVQQHGGCIGVHSVENEGTEFRIYLPATDKRPVKSTKPDSNLYAGQGRVLVMDDEQIVRQVATDMLFMMGFHVDQACNGEEAVEKYERAMEIHAPYRAVLLDLVIRDGMGGRETLEKLQAMDPDVKAIVSSAYSEDPVLANPARHGFAGHILKPYRVQNMSRVVRETLEKK